MTDEDKTMFSDDQFLALLNIPHCEIYKAHEHKLHFGEVAEAQIHILMGPELVGDACTEVNPKNLAYENKVLFYTLCNSLTPTNQPETIGGIMANAFNATYHGIRYDVPDLFIQNMVYAASGAQAFKPYALWIMYG